MSPADRSAAAYAFLHALRADGDEESAILTGPGLSPDERDARLDIAPDMETQLTDLCGSIMDDLRIGSGRYVSDLKACAKIKQRAADHALRAGEQLSVRADGITLHTLTSPDDATWVIGQIALDCANPSGPVFAGIYLGTSLYVDPHYRERGIGSDLVVEHVLHNGSILNWELDSCAYSPGGARAHIRALSKLDALAAQHTPEEISLCA